MTRKQTLEEPLADLGHFDKCAEMADMIEQQADWDLVEEAFEDDAPECAECEFFFYQYWSDTGAETSCNLLDGDKGKPWMCPAYDRKKEEAEDA